MTAAEEFPEKPCALCAGTGKVRDYGTTASPFSAPTYFTIDAEQLEKWNIVPMFGT